MSFQQTMSQKSVDALRNPRSHLGETQYRAMPLTGKIEYAILRERKAGEDVDVIFLSPRALRQLRRELNVPVLFSFLGVPVRMIGAPNEVTFYNAVSQRLRYVACWMGE